MNVSSESRVSEFSSGLVLMQPADPSVLKRHLLFSLCNFDVLTRRFLIANATERRPSTSPHSRNVATRFPVSLGAPPLPGS